MANSQKNQNAPESMFSYGVREMQRATATHELSIEVAAAKPANENRGVNPYDTSGGFDRKKNWMRVGKR